VADHGSQPPTLCALCGYVKCYVGPTGWSLPWLRALLKLNTYKAHLLWPIFSPRQKTAGITRLRSQDAEDLDAVLEVVANVQQAVTRQVNIWRTNNPLRKVKHSVHHTISREDLWDIKTSCTMLRMSSYTDTLSPFSVFWAQAAYLLMQTSFTDGPAPYSTINYAAKENNYS